MKTENDGIEDTSIVGRAPSSETKKNVIRNLEERSALII